MTSMSSRVLELQTLKREIDKLKDELATEKDKVFKSQMETRVQRRYLRRARHRLIVRYLKGLTKNLEIKRYKKLIVAKNKTIKELRGNQSNMTFQQKRCAHLEKHPLKIKSLLDMRTPQRQQPDMKSSKISNMIRNPVEDSQSSKAQGKHYNLRPKKDAAQANVPQKDNAQGTSGSIGGTGSTPANLPFPIPPKSEPGLSSMNAITFHKRDYARRMKNTLACICGYNTEKKRNLTNHLKYYQTRIYFKCQITDCREKFNATSRLKQHMWIQHKAKFRQRGCKNCGGLFENKNKLMSHCRTDHKQIWKAVVIDITNDGCEVTPPSAENGSPVEPSVKIPLRTICSPVPPPTTGAGSAAGPSFATPISSIPASGMDMRQVNSGDCLEASSSGLTEQDGVDPESSCSRNVLKVETEVTPSTSAAMWPIKLEGEVYGMYKPCHF